MENNAIDQSRADPPVVQRVVRPPIVISRTAQSLQYSPYSLDSYAQYSRGYDVNQSANEKGLPAQLSASNYQKLKIGDDVLELSPSPFASGGFSALHIGRFEGKDVAVKVIDLTAEGAEEDFMKEVRIMLLRHPNVMECVQATKINGKGYIIMPYMKYGTVANRTMDTASTIRVLYHVAIGMEFLHSHGIVHRDLKADNVLLSENGVPVISDFGAASVQAELIEGEWGTVTHMAPEMFQGKCYQKEVDVYAFGMLAFELVMGRMPWIGHPTQKIKDMVVEDYRPQFTHPDAELAHLVKKCWDPRPEKRPAFAQCVSMLDKISARYV